MALILNIETATNVCSVALAQDGNMLSIHENNEGQSHARVLTTLITKCLNSAQKKFSDLEAIAVSKGPGSYTGLRIGVATAKGLCFSLDIPLISVNTLQSMASTLKAKILFSDNILFSPMIDARRMEVYTAIFNHSLEFIEPTSAKIINENSYLEILENSKILFFADGMKKAMDLIGNHNNAIFLEDFEPSASGMIVFSENSYIANSFEQPAYFEPFYLKDFYTPQQP